ncbi:MAG: hypothetical protein H6807_14390 [Planctomycetes bacterium]|nr:hypothetical protein [Planctomycetota bacterium]
MRSIDLKSVALAVLATVLVIGHFSDRGATAQAGRNTDSNPDMIAVTGDYGNGTSILWVIDTKDRQLAAYRSINGSSIELVGARKITWDLKLQGFRDRSPEGYSPAALEKQYLDWEAGRVRGSSPAGGAPEKAGEEKEK